MSNVYIKRGRQFIPNDEEELNVVKKIPVGVYTVVRTRQGYILENASDFIMPKKVYGNTEFMASRILNTYQDRPTSTGVLLSGTSGAGKSLLAKCVSVKGFEQDIITIVINERFYGDDFNLFIQSIEQPAIILFDEFEKNYDSYEQEQLLTLFDGVYSQKKLFIITCNDPDRVDRHMINRPGRIYYALNFAGISGEFAKEFCEDNLIDKNHIEAIVSLVNENDTFSFDMLQAIVEEMNRYDETVEQAVELLNIDNIDVSEKNPFQNLKRSTERIKLAR